MHVSTYRTLKTKRLNSAVWKMRPPVNAKRGSSVDCDIIARKVAGLPWNRPAIPSPFAPSYGVTGKVFARSKKVTSVLATP